VPERGGRSGQGGKRAFDTVMAGCALVVLSPVMAGIALAIRVTMGSPILFRQVRPGLHGHPFTILKFRSMTVARDKRDELLNSDKRVTRLGAFLRRTSLDELPELWNVMRGDMSLVGPRPLLMEYLPHYSADQARRHDMRPGITGLAQVRGRHDSAWEDRFRLDTWYVDHWSLRLDARIIVDTLRVLLDGQAVPDPSSESYWFAGVEEATDDTSTTPAGAGH
jgi:lipopolysaccharide/colanic/teichoic acid biosynthesis glycosyltransferase